MKNWLLIFVFTSLSLKSFGQNSDSVAVIQNNNSYSRFKRVYLFNSIDFVKEGKELVVIVERPQSQLARDIGCRIYSDTALLQKMKRDFYEDVDMENLKYHYCSYDTYFYIKSGNNLKLWSVENSQCGLNRIGCDNFELLAESGRMLKMDTIRQWKFKEKNNGKIIPDNVIYAQKMWKDGSRVNSVDRYCNTSSKPNWAYSSKIDVSIPVKTPTSIDSLISDFLKHIDSLSFRDINYHLDEEMFENVELNKFTGDEFRFTVYLNKDSESYFKDFKIVPNRHKKGKENSNLSFLFLLTE